MDSPVNFPWADTVISITECGRQVDVALSNMGEYLRKNRIDTVNVAGRRLIVKQSWDNHLEKIKAKQASAMVA